MCFLSIGLYLKNICLVESYYSLEIITSRMCNSCIDLVSTQTSAHRVRGHARPRRNNTHQHWWLFYSGPSQEDPSGMLKENAIKKKSSHQILKRFLFSPSIFSVCRHHSLEQETISSGWNRHGGKCWRRLCSLLSFRTLQHDSHLSRRSVTACVYLWHFS